ncbi:MAG: energy transducer TonB [Prevotellaceae bacterium]|jgi:TonB family protein|nr:energy transducer TonB [Prevotellaceae bacterium]
MKRGKQSRLLWKAVAIAGVSVGLTALTACSNMQPKETDSTMQVTTIVGKTPLPSEEETGNAACLDSVYDVCEEPPQYPDNGMQGLLEYTIKNFNYTPIMQEMCVQGRIIVQIIVDKDGSILCPKVLKGVERHYDEEALRVVSSMPKWIPGRQRGEAVRARYTIPVLVRAR